MKTTKQVCLKTLSMVLTLALLISCVPNQVFAMAGEALMSAINADDTLTLQTEQELLGTERIVEEDTSKRGESYKEYILNNGLRLATIYPSAIHYEDDGEWKDIDNTLIATRSGGKAYYTNTAGKWNVRFPQSLSGNSMVGVTKDGYTIQFGMAGELRSTGDVVVASVGQIGNENATGTLAVSTAQASTAQIQPVDLTAARDAAEYPETVLDTLNSRLTYANIYPNTNVVYDLKGNQLKESILLQQYDSSLWGYRYNLDTGGLIPILNESKQIDLCDPVTDEVVLTMPAPYMLDNNGEYNENVEVSLVRNGSNYLLSYYLPREWLADANRAWPVILDPIVSADGNYSNIRDCTIGENGKEAYNHGTIRCGYSETYGKMWMYMKYVELPPLTSADVIVDATISLRKTTTGTTTAVVEVHKVLDDVPWDSETINWENKPGYDETIEDYHMCHAEGRYVWSITDIVRSWYENENTGMMFKAANETEEAQIANWKQFYSSDYDSTSAEYMPLLNIKFQNANGLEDYWSYNSSSAGRAGTGYVNLFTGNLTWVRGDLGFDGNRMPVSISHVYNSNDSQTNKFGMGYGWRTNYNQTITSSGNGIYIWEDGDGTRHYFYQAINGEGNVVANTYLDEDGLHLTLTTGGTGDAKYQLADQYGNKSYFNASGYLVKLENNQATPSSISITYKAVAPHLIDTITDGAGRVYSFTYTDYLLTRISYKGTGTTELTYVLYTYANGNLIRITDKDARYTSYTYSDHLLTEAQDGGGYSITYSYEEETAQRVDKIEEYARTSLGNSVAIEYDTHYTIVTDHRGNHTYHQFNDWGNLVAIHDSMGHVQYTKYALNDMDDLVSDTAEPHQVVEISSIDGVSNNILFNGSFEDGEPTNNASGWSSFGRISNDRAYRGSQSMRISTDYYGGEITEADGPQYSIAPGETYTFSAYIWLEDGTDVEVTFGDTSVWRLAAETNGWTRIQISYTNEEPVIRAVYPKFKVRLGTIYVDCVQIEKATAASPYNELENGDFLPNNSTNANGWGDGAGGAISNYYADVNAANLLLSAGAVGFIGNPNAERHFEQTLSLSGVTGDAFVLAGWALGDAAPLRDEREFGLKLIFHNTDNTETVYYTSFDSDVSPEHWQYAAVTAVAKKYYNSITVQAVYNYQTNMAYFDGLQLTKGRAGTTYTYDSNKNVEMETNILGQTTTYTYDNSGVNLVGVDASVGNDVSYVYDEYHNVKQMTEIAKYNGEDISATTYEYEYDDFGNVLSVLVMQTDLHSNRTPLVQKSVTTYTENGNYITSTIDGNGKTTTYGYNEQTGVLDWVQYPEDTVDTRTHYKYDEMYRLKKTYTTTNQTDQNNQHIEMSAEYFYSGDLLTELRTKSVRYEFLYNKFDLCEAVFVGNNLLVRYQYTNDQNHYLTKLDYANEDSVEYTYDSLGRVIKETYFEDGEQEEPSRIIRYSYDGSGAVARIKDSVTSIESVCWYDYAGRVAVLMESDGESFYREIVNSYDANGNVTKVEEKVQKIGPYIGRPNVEEYLYGYEYFYDFKNRIELVETNDTIKEYSYDKLDRVMRERVATLNDRDVLTILYSYSGATVGETSVTTHQVESKAISAYHYMKHFVYEYDDNGNIISIGGDDDVVYTYDSANQLLQEYNEYAQRIWQWTYDDAGNISSKKEINLETGTETNYVYEYENANWGDLLTFYDGQNLYYDENGNLTNDGTWTYTWEQGRQLATMSDGTTTWTYTYDANGMRVGRTNGTDTYTYLYTNGLLSMMTKGDKTLYFTYDAAGMPLTVNYNGITYYYVTNLQGDVIAIVDGNGYAVAEYIYNAWGYQVSAVSASSTDLCSINPLRYRGYIYDGATGLYYLQSRYYDPEIGRFISADAYVSTGQGILGDNMYTYCGNNPCMHTDPTGEFFFTALGAAVGFVAGAITATLTGQSEKALEIACESAIGGAIAGAGIDVGLLLIGSFGTALPVVTMAAVTAFAAGGIGNAFTTYANSDGTATDEQLTTSFILGGIGNVISLATGGGAVAPNVEQLMIAGMNQFQNNFKIGFGIALCTSFATTIATDSYTFSDLVSDFLSIPSRLPLPVIRIN